MAMNELIFAPAAGGDTSSGSLCVSAPGGLSVCLPSIDWTQLVPNLVGLFIQAIGSLMYGAMRSFYLALWNGLLLSVPHDLTDQFGPVKAMMPPPSAIGTAGLVLALSLLGLRTYIRGL